MNLVEQLRDGFACLRFNNALKVDGLPSEYPAWILKGDDWIAVGLPTDDYTPFSKECAKIRMYAVPDIEIGDLSHKMLLLQCSDMVSRNEFAVKAAKFVDPGNDRHLRQELIAAPEAWWNRWKNISGNIGSNLQPYDIIGEMLVLERSMQEGAHPRWVGVERGTHTIELDMAGIEVKSTTKRCRYEVPIHGVYQLLPMPGKRLYLDFLRFERADEDPGRNVNNLAQSLKQLGFDEEELEMRLAVLGLEAGRGARNRRYRVVEWQRYSVDDTFPAITETSFKRNRLPRHVVGLTYTLDLAGLPGSNVL